MESLDSPQSTLIPVNSALLQDLSKPKISKSRVASGVSVKTEPTSVSFQQELQARSQKLQAPTQARPQKNNARSIQPDLSSSGQPPAKRAKSLSKSRNGCNTCKKKRLKCDETKPACNNCTKRNIACGGYATRYKWRVFNEGKEEPLQTEPFAGRKESSQGGTTILKSESSANLMHLGPLGDGGILQGKSGPGNAMLLASPNTGTTNKRVQINEARLPRGLVSGNQGELKPLLLNEHLELAALSVVGKSSKEIEIEQNLLAKGLNPQSYRHDSIGDFGPNAHDQPQRGMRHKMQRSYSSENVPVDTPSPTALQRSRSLSTYNVPTEVQTFRAAHSSIGLHSLAEAAVDEMRVRSPASTPSLPHFPHSAGVTPESLPLSHYYGPDKTPRISSAVPTPKPWLFNTIHGDTMHGAKDILPEINITPSLSAIINYAFTEDGQRHPEHYSTKLLGGPEGGAPSPLDLNLAHQLEVGSPVDPRRPSIASSLGKVVTPNVHFAQENTPQDSSELLYEVGCQLMRHACPSPSIIRGVSHDSLLRSSEHEQILFLYSTYTCGIMSIKSGVAENPWKNLYLPVCSDYPYLFNSIASMTLFHLACNSNVSENSALLRSKGYAYMKSCILELASGLSKMENNLNCDYMFPADVALATCLNLAVSESWDTHISSGIAHLKGANSMIQKVLSVIKQYLAAGRKGNAGGASRAMLRKKLVFVNNEEWKKIENFDLEHKDSSVLTDMYVPRNLQLLFNQWIYFEVLSQMTCYNGQDIKGIDLVATITKIIQKTEKKRDEETRSAENTTSPLGSQDLHGNSVNGALSADQFFLEKFDAMLKNVDYVDPLLGCAQSLFLIMGRVANLISKVRLSREKDPKQVRNSLTNISLASELKQQLVDWRPNISAQMAELGSKESKDSSWDFYSCISTAEAYRYATLLYLHEAVPEVPLILSHQLAEKIFVLLASIPSNSNLFIVHIFPLLVSSCEAEPGEEREWCLSRWASLSTKLWIGNIDRAFEVVKEVWRRKDEQMQKSSDTAIQEKLDLNDPRDFSVHLHGLMSSINKNKVADDKGIVSKTHWSTIMREWGWEVLLA